MKKILSIVFVLNFSTCTNTMDNKPNNRKIIKPIHVKPKRKSPFRKLSYPAAFAQFITNQTKPIKYYGGKRHIRLLSNTDAYEEIIDLRTKVPIANDTLYNLIEESVKAKRPYFLAAVLVNEKIENKETKQIIEKIGRHYHDAAYLIEWIFNEYFQRKQNRKDPVTNQTLWMPIHFFKVEKLEGSIEYFASEFDLKQNNETVQYMCALLKSKLEIPKDILQLARSYHLALGTPQDLQKAKTYYKKSSNQGYIEGVIGTGNIYLEQNKYTKAERHFLTAAKQNDTEGQLNLVYLFAIEQSTRTIDEIITRFIAAQEDIMSMDDYAQNYPNRWELIEQCMADRGIEIPYLASQPNNPFSNESDSNNEFDNLENETNDTEMESGGYIAWPIPGESDDEQSEENNNVLESISSLFQSNNETTPLLENAAENAMSNNLEHNEQILWPHLNTTEQQQFDELLTQVPEQNNQTIHNSIDSLFSDDTNAINEWEDIDNQLENLQNMVYENKLEKPSD